MNDATDSTPTWTLDTAGHKIARLGDRCVFLTRSRVSFGAGDRRNGYVWTAEVVGPDKATIARKMVAGKREALAMLVAAC